MYICRDCKKIFEEPKIYTETHGLNNPPYEKWSGCPICSGTYTTANICSVCDTYITTDNYIKLKNGDCICENCYDIVEI